MNIVGDVFVTVILTLFFMLFLSAIAYFIFGSSIEAVLFVYIAAAFISSHRSSPARMEFKTDWIISSILTTFIIFLIINFGFVHIFGSAFSFPYSILNLSPFLTGTIFSIACSIIYIFFSS